MKVKSYVAVERLLLWTAFLGLPGLPVAQDPITIPLHFEKKLDGEGHGFLPLFEYEGTGVIRHEGIELEIVTPPLAENERAAYGFVYFAGRPGAFSTEILFLVEGYDTAEPRFHVDLDNNLDLTDDAPSVELEEDTGEYLMTLVAASDPSHTFTVRLGFFRDDPKMQGDATLAQQYETMLAGYVKRMGAKAIAARHWFGDQRLNVRSASTRIDGIAIQVGVCDWDCNGTYADDKDRVVSGAFEAKFLPRSRSSGAVALGGETLVRMGERAYEVVEVDAAGAFLRLVATDKEYVRLLDGDRLPDFDLMLFDGTTAPLSSFLEPQKMLLLDFWGHWCPGCVRAMPKLVEAAETTSDHLKIVPLLNEV